MPSFQTVELNWSRLLLILQALSPPAPVLCPCVATTTRHQGETNTVDQRSDWILVNGKRLIDPIDCQESSHIS